MAEDGDGGPGGPMDIDPDAPSAEVAAYVLENHGYLSWLNISVEDLEEGRAVMHLPYQEKLANWVTGTIHGGVTATLIDTCSAFALRTTMDDPMETTLATTDLDVKYVRPATSDIEVEAAVIRSGTSTGVTRVTVTGETDDGEEKIVAIGATTYRLFTDSDI
ncbi:PaaI family thioesterase [Halorientalis sp. IM1011]|uniref:PaaI family thioesterase n=1 Tax=Halorientalis sp. IM1011 TaxID=1932360 RepID=UPI0020A59D3C|nr:PaaI family thioesterase [Halorientalis sp. IM1011]